MKLSNHKIIKGTLILSAAGFITRIIGFIYKIYLADLLGAKMLGLYQLVFPVYAICFTIYGAGIQTAISQVIAAETSKKDQSHPGRVLAAGMILSLMLACSLCFLVYTRAEWIAIHFVMEPALTPYLQILSVLFPFCSVSACINGYYYGIQEAAVPAISQMVEQIVRVLFVWLFCMGIATAVSPEKCCFFAVWGLVAGEAAAAVYNVLKIAHYGNTLRKKNLSTAIRQHAASISSPKWKNRFLSTLLWLSFSLTITRLLVSFLNSVESILLPAMLRSYGCSPADALSIYGVLTGMSLSFIFFPSTITHSFAVMLLPSVAEAHARQDHRKIQRSITLSIKYCILIGLLCTCFFLVFGKELGNIFFHNEDAGNYLVVLSWLCPFLYLGTTLTSVINGMEKTHITFFYTILSLGIKIAILLFAVPIFGIHAYLAGLLVSELVLVLLEFWFLRAYIHMDAYGWILLPSLLLTALGFLAKNSYEFLQSCFQGWYILLPLALITLLLCVIYGILLFLSGVISKKDIKQG